MINDFQYYKGNNLSRSEKMQRGVLQILLESDLPDDERESSVIWEIKHSSSCMQLGRILAQKRNLNTELVEIICVLHDVYVAVEGKYEKHASKSAEISRRMLTESMDFNPEEIDMITEAIAYHSEKQIYSDNPYVELIKDIDVFDCSLYENAEGFFSLHKPKEIYNDFINRIKRVRKELGLNEEETFRKTK